jgi:methylmalonyl-CoA/ethylmalonyl-CoA epimerase
MTKGLAHIGIAVHSISETLPIYQQILGFKLETIKESKQHKIKAAMLSVGQTHIELIEPLDDESSISKFLQKRGQGIHHIALKVENIEDALSRLKAKDITLIDEEPRVGVEGGKIAFIHPKSTGNVLIELCQE